MCCEKQGCMVKLLFDYCALCKLNNMSGAMNAHLNENKCTLVQYLDIVHPRLLGVTILRKPSNQWKTFCIGPTVKYVYREEGARALAVAVPRQAEGCAVAAPAVDLAVGPVVDRGGVQAAAAVGAGEAALVPTLQTKIL